MPDEAITNGSWFEYKRLVLKQLEDQTHELHEQDKEISKLKTDLAILKTKVALYAVGIAVGANVLIQVGLYILKRLE